MKDKKNKFILLFNLTYNLLYILSDVIEFENEEGKVIAFHSIKYIGIRKLQTQKFIKNKRIKYTPYTFVRVSEPIIIMIKEFLEEILKRIILLDEAKNELNIVGFRLKLDSWLRPCSSLFDNLKFFTSLCNCDCLLCYNKNSPFKINYTMSLKEAKTRIKYFDPIKRRALFPIVNEFGEPFLNPHTIEILELAREKDPNSPIDITTNGTFLTKEIVKRLSKLKPIYVSVSLNSANLYLRKKFMKGNGHHNVISGISLLREYEISFKGTIITWPGLPLNDIGKSIEFLQEMDAVYIALYLPGATKFNLPSNLTVKELWKRYNEIKDFFLKIRSQFDLPIFLIPNSYWLPSIRAVIDGVIKNSPAYRNGLKLGDRILKINNEDIFSRDCFWRKMTELRNKQIKKISVTIERSGQIKTITLEEFDEDEYSYPYRPKGYPVEPGNFWGIMMARSISIPSIRKLKEFIASNNFSKVLVFVSPLMMRQLKEIDRYINFKNYFGKSEVRFFLTKNYFWGGNIILGDLMMVEDFCKLLENPQIKKFQPEVVVIPKTFLSSWGRDFKGEVYTEIEKRTGFKIFLLPCVKINT